MTKYKKGQINIVLQEKRQDQKMPEPVPQKPNHRIFARIDSRFSSFVGLDELKMMAKQIYATMIVNKKREEIGLKSSGQVLHMMFKGNPGTGKTTVARELAKLLHEMELLSKGHFIEAERADLVGEYIGQTAQKTRALIQKAIGGILFIDEAYSLGRGGEKDFGKEAIDTLVKHMEDHQNDFVLILAGYPDEMDNFLELNPGLHSRFPFILEFPDYNLDQLMDIARRKFAKLEYELSKEAEWRLRSEIEKERMCRNFANGRYIRNIVEKTIRSHAMRLLTRELYSAKDLIEIKEMDLDFE
ncbi:AAA family ATPase [Aciduricibacillus chroicocephali]|uniref:AAA family ATPase n=2 Tax=Aciduricibacillus chroicocephali TaxID=3054939 RepID=A0ABY9KYW6_9BACI|nr:AAA family ATPase [Bacillaceae bacterium 44XB]